MKLARAATGRTRLIACDRGYHGKTCGALSVTGPREFKERFEPLLPDCHSIPFGNLPALHRALDGHNAAAFIVEPIAAEGGIYPLPDGFLTQAAAWCREAGTLFVVDEVQTGLGRTGRLFAVEREAVVPDILCLAKSLGGGVLPMGAVLCRRSVWMQAYGTLDTCLLQTSTFAGGSLASAAALATLDVLADGGLIQNAAARGAELLAGLQQLADRFAVIRSVRGQGLLLGVEFAPLPEAIAEHWLQQSGLLPLLIPNLRERVASLPAFYVMQALLRHHRIFTQLCRSQPRVLRIEPPLTISAQDVRRFLSSLESCVEQIDLSNQMFAACLSKTMRGELDVRDNAPDA
jgi:putrescine aminotransferase